MIKPSCSSVFILNCPFKLPTIYNSVRPSVWSSVCFFSVFLFIHSFLNIRLSLSVAHPFFCQSIHPTSFIFDYPFIGLFIHVFRHPFIFILSVHPFVICPSSSISICLTACLFTIPLSQYTIVHLSSSIFYCLSVDLSIYRSMYSIV